ncbi:uncharacterized protein [Dermacentor albipictus]|uniref:uncharacterized protein n=1 Tax=Dermacentor albipictus TaxID=60249 RepID=UPI0038FC9508
MIPSTCTRGHRRVCHLFRHLTACNKVLWHAGLQLREEFRNKLGDLSVRTVPGVCLGSTRCELCTHNEEAALSLLRWLLKRHLCIVSVAANYGAANTSPLVEALQASSRLERLTLFGNASDQVEVFEQSPGCSVGHACSAERMKIPARLLEKDGAGLVSLDVSELKLSADMAKKLIDALLRNDTITELTVGGCFFASGPLEAASVWFTEYLVKKNGTLRKLKLVERQLVFATAALQTLAQGISTMTTLEGLSVEGQAASKDCALFLEAVAHSPSLQSVCLLLERSDEDFLDPQADENVDALGVPTWVLALQENSKLKHLKLSLTWSTREDCYLLLEALGKQCRLKMLTLQTVPRDCGIEEICRIIRDGGVGERVRIGSYAFLPEDVEMVSACEAVTAVTFSSFIFLADVAALRNMFNVIATCNHVTLLRVYLHFFDNDAFALLAAYITGSTYIKAIQLIIEIYDFGEDWDEIEQEHDESLRQSLSNLCEALSLNRSISNIYLDSTIELRRQDCQMLADAALNNRQLYELILPAVRGSSVPLFLGRLLPRLAENYNLLLLEIPFCLQHNDEMCAAQDVVRRNCGLAQRAARFVMGDHGPECARPFELLSGDPVLVESVLRKLEQDRDRAQVTGIEKAEAVSKIEKARQLLRNADLHTYMKMTGVVQERVECEVQEDGSKQLDKLNEYCFLHILRYLKIADVVEA